MDKLLKPAEVAAILRVEVALARELMRQMPYINLTGCSGKPRLLVAERDLEAWIQARKHQAEPAAAPASKRKTAPLRVLEGFEPDGRLKRRKA